MRVSIKIFLVVFCFWGRVFSEQSCAKGGIEIEYGKPWIFLDKEGLTKNGHSFSVSLWLNSKAKKQLGLLFSYNGWDYECGGNGPSCSDDEFPVISHLKGTLAMPGVGAAVRTRPKSLPFLGISYFNQSSFNIIMVMFTNRSKVFWESSGAAFALRPSLSIEWGLILKHYPGIDLCLTTGVDWMFGAGFFSGNLGLAVFLVP